MDKKGAIMEVILLGILLPLIGFFALMGVYHTAATQTDIEASLQACKFSILISDRVDDLSKGLFNVNNMCKTINIDMPEKKSLELEEGPEGLYKDIGTRMNDCWWEFGEGIQGSSVFASDIGEFFDTKCFTCFTFNTKESGEDKLDFEDLFKYLQEKPLHARKDRVLICENIDTEKIHDVDCVSQEKYNKMSECEKKGGECGVCTVGETIAYDGWKCNNGESCCVKQENMVTYLSNIYLEKGRGSVWFSEDIAKEGILKDQEYAITYVSRKKTFAEKASQIIMGGGAAAGAGAAIATFALVSNPGGWIAGGIILGSAAAGAVAASVGKEEMEDLIAKHDKIFVTKAAEIEDYCTVISESGKRR